MNLLLEKNKHKFNHFLFENTQIDERYRQILEYYVNEAAIDDLIDISTRGTRSQVFTLNDMELLGLDYSRKIVRFKFDGETDTYKTRIQLLDWSTISRLKGTDIDKLNLALQGEVRVDCTCPDYQFRYRYVATQYDASIRTENRPTDITNPDYDGAICKHLHFTLINIDQFKDEIQKLRQEEREKQRKRDERKKE